jgi:hypothetical protein
MRVDGPQSQFGCFEKKKKKKIADPASYDAMIPQTCSQ